MKNNSSSHLKKHDHNPPCNGYPGLTGVDCSRTTTPSRVCSRWLFPHFLFPGSPPLPLSRDVDRRSSLQNHMYWLILTSLPITEKPGTEIYASKTLRMNHPVHTIHNLMLSSTGCRTGFYRYFHESYCHFKLSYEATILSTSLLSTDISKDINRTMI